jgi:myo-inositol-1(or 4)-monophosphatase
MREIEFIEKTLRELSPYVRQQYGNRAARSIETKSDAADLLTETDLEVQRRILESLRRQFPDDAFVGEESGHQQPPADPNARCWIVDPIDGTHNFVKGIMPTFGITIAFAINQRPVAGGIIFPALEQLFLAEKGKGCTRNGRPVHVSSITELPGAKIECDFGRPHLRQLSTATYMPVLMQVGQIRSQGCAVVSLCDVAAGEAEAYVHVGLSPWDYAAGMLMVEESGGVVTRLDGSPIDLFDGRKGLLAANPTLHRRLIKVMHNK